MTLTFDLVTQESIGSSTFYGHDSYPVSVGLSYRQVGGGALGSDRMGVHADLELHCPHVAVCLAFS